MAQAVIGGGFSASRACRVSAVDEKASGMRAYIDSDVLIWHLCGEPKALKFLKSLRETGVYEFWTGAMQRAEVVFFMRPGE